MLGLIKLTVYLEGLGIIKFNTVVGNPPYNGGIDYDFIDKSIDLQTRVVFIVPQKVFTQRLGSRDKSQIDLGVLRKKFVGHISDIVFFPDCTDVFNILLAPGVVYFNYNRDRHYNYTLVRNVSTVVEEWNNIDRMKLGEEGVILNNQGRKLFRHLHSFTSFTPFKFDFPLDRKYKVYMCVKFNAYAGKSYIFNKNGKAYVTQIMSLIRKTEDIKELQNSDICVFQSDNINECLQFIQFIYSKFVRYTLLYSVQALTCFNNDYIFRNVPLPDRFDHIFTDEELYSTYDIPTDIRDTINTHIVDRRSIHVNNKKDIWVEIDDLEKLWKK